MYPIVVGIVIIGIVLLVVGVCLSVLTDYIESGIWCIIIGVVACIVAAPATNMYLDISKEK